MYNHILVPLDGSKNAFQAENVALRLAKRFKSKITLLSVVNDVNLFIANSASPASGSNEDLPISWLNVARSYAKKILEEGKQKARTFGVSGALVETKITQGSAKQIIAEDFPKDHNIGLIVIGKSGKHALNRLFVGSTTSYVVRNSLTKVLVINNKVPK